MSDYMLELCDVSKSFPGVKALDGVSFALRRGEIHALVGENGAGKSTLIKIITGVHRPDGGRIVLDGATISFADPLSAQKNGIAAIYQEPTTFPDLSVAENIFMGHPILARVLPAVTRLPTRVTGFLSRVDWKAMYREASRLLGELEADIDPRAPMKTLTVAERQLVEVAKALSLRARVLIMDEPTSALTVEETKRLFKIMRQLRSGGTGIIFISHRLDEVLEISDRITVLRDGQFIASLDTSAATEQQVIQHMVGRHVDSLYPEQEIERGEVVLRVEGLTRYGEFNNISFTVHRGEIVGFAGLVGAGRTEMARAIFGITRPDSGLVMVDNRLVKIRCPEDALRSGIAYLPEDRQQHGLVLPMSVVHNVTLSILRHVLLGLTNERQEQRIAGDHVDLLSIRTASLLHRVSQLSGGNQQKVVLAKWLATNPKVLILDEPTKGIDVQAKAAVHRLIGELAAQGLGIVMISSELPEILGMSDQIIVMHEGVITGRFARGEADQEQILMAAIGRART